MQTFMGYERPDGSVGIRNHVVIMPTTACANGVAQRIAQAVPEAIPMLHTLGCGRPSENERLQNILANILKNPNHFAVVLIGLGCEGLSMDYIVQELEQVRKPVFHIKLQEHADAETAIERCIQKTAEFVEQAKQCVRTPIGFDRLIVGTECGASDGLSGPLANRLIGELVDWLVEEGGTAILSESIELIGAESILSKRSVNQSLAEEICTVVAKAEKDLSDAIGWEAAHTVNKINLDGGMTTIREKALGCVCKSGSHPITGLIFYAQPLGDLRGLVIQDGPGFDPESVAGLFGSGAQLVLFSTGRGNMLGFPSSPVLKVASCNDTYVRFAGFMDINAGEFLTEGKSMEQLVQEGKELFTEILNGKKTAAERQKQGGMLCIQTVTSAL